MPSRKSAIGSLHSETNSTRSTSRNGPPSSSTDGNSGSGGGGGGGGSGGGGVISSHSSRVEDVRRRTVAFDAQTVSLSAYIAASATGGLLTVTGGTQELARTHGLSLQDNEDFNNVTQSNLPGFSLLKRGRIAAPRRSVYVHVIKLAAASEPYKAQLLAESLKILKYFCGAGSSHTDIGHGSQTGSHSSTTGSSASSSSSPSSYFLRLIEIYLMEASDPQQQEVLVVEEKFPLENCLQYYLLNGAYHGPGLKARDVKRWAIKLAEAMEVLNVSGVAHRFLRPENVVMSVSRDISHQLPKVAAFDCAVLYWDAETKDSIPLARGLPLPGLKSYLLDHMPPECFTDGYNGSQVDAWSLGVLILQLATGSTPFSAVVAEITSEAATPATSAELNVQFIEAWKRCKERLWITEELRSLLDDVFKEADARITLWEIAKDFRLTCKDPSEFVRKKNIPPYYRIDLQKNINVDGPPEKTNRPPSDAQVSSILPSTFSEQSASIFVSKGVINLREGNESALPGYRVLRDQSFEGDLSPEVIINDYYLKAVRVVQQQQQPSPQPNQQGQPPPSSSSENSVISMSDTPGAAGTTTVTESALVKIVAYRHIPVAHRNMLLNESSKIMRFFSSTEPMNARVHRTLDIFLLSDTYIYIFYEPLEGMRSLAVIVGRLQEEGGRFPPPLRLPPAQEGGGSSAGAANSAVNSNLLTLPKLQTVIRDLAQTAAYLAQHGLSHRYIRPEYVFVNEADYSVSKLTHFDLACFVWNPQASILIKRSRGIQDRQEHLWSHLPPECYEAIYDTRLVDVWSIGTLLAFCLCGVIPFGASNTACTTIEQAVEVWNAFKGGRHNYVFQTSTIAQVTEILSKGVFVALENRLSAQKLVEKFSSSTLFHRRGRSAEAVGKGGGAGGHGNRASSTSRPNSRGRLKHHLPKTNPRLTGKAGKQQGRTSKGTESTPVGKGNAGVRKQAKK